MRERCTALARRSWIRGTNASRRAHKGGTGCVITAMAQLSAHNAIRLH
jgi:hypothetical protein